jgi:hypothetical protein
MANNRAHEKQLFRENAELVLADYRDCRDDDGFHADEGDGKSQSQEIAKRLVDNFVTIVKPKNRPTDAEEKIEALLYDEALHELDAWAACRNASIRKMVVDAVADSLFGKPR